MKFIVNNNGDSAQALKDKYLAIHNAANELENLMRQCRPNGRNYQTNPDAQDYDSDRALWETLITNANTIGDVSHNAALRAYESR